MKNTLERVTREDSNRVQHAKESNPDANHTVILQGFLHPLEAKQKSDLEMQIEVQKMDVKIYLSTDHTPENKVHILKIQDLF